MLQPGSPDPVSPDLNHLQSMNSLAGPLGPELSNVLQPALAKGRSRGSLSFGDETSASILEKEDDSQVRVAAAYFKNLTS